MINFTYAISTRSYFGKGQIKNLGKNIIPYSRKVLLVTGQGSIRRNGIYDFVYCRTSRYDKSRNDRT